MIELTTGERAAVRGIQFHLGEAMGSLYAAHAAMDTLVYPEHGMGWSTSLFPEWRTVLIAAERAVQEGVAQGELIEALDERQEPVDPAFLAFYKAVGGGVVTMALPQVLSENTPYEEPGQ